MKRTSAKRKVPTILVFLMLLQNLAHSCNEDFTESNNIQDIIVNATRTLNQTLNSRLTSIEKTLQNMDNYARNTCSINACGIKEWSYTAALVLTTIQTFCCLLFAVQLVRILCLKKIRTNKRNISCDERSKLITVLVSACFNGFFLPWYTWRFMQENRYGPSFKMYAGQFAIFQNAFSLFIWVASFAVTCWCQGNNIILSTWTPIATSFITSAGAIIAIVLVPAPYCENSITSGILTTALITISTSLLTMVVAIVPLGLNDAP